MSWIDDYLRYTASQESPTQFHRWCALSTIAATLNNRVRLDRRGPEGIVYFTDYPGQLSVCLVAGAGRCKKSTAVNIAKPFMREGGVAIFDGKITPERLLAKMASMPGGKPVLTVVAGELSAFLSKASYNDGLIDILLKLIDCDNNPYETQTRIFKLTDPCLTLLMATTPYSLGKSIPPQAHDTGFLSRHIFVYSDRPGASQPLAFNTSDLDPIIVANANLLRDSLCVSLRRYMSISGEFTWSPDAQRWFTNHYNNYRQLGVSDGEGYPQRRPSHLCRVAMCLQIAQNESLVLEQATLELADQWLTEAEADMHKAFAFIGQNGSADKQDLILRVFRDEATRTNQPAVGTVLKGEDIYFKTIKKMSSPKELEDQVKALISAGVIGYLGPDKSGKHKLYTMMKEPY